MGAGRQLEGFKQHIVDRFCRLEPGAQETTGLGPADFQEITEHLSGFLRVSQGAPECLLLFGRERTVYFLFFKEHPQSGFDYRHGTFEFMDQKFNLNLSKKRFLRRWKFVRIHRILGMLFLFPRLHMNRTVLLCPFG